MERAHLVLEGVSEADLTTDFLVAVMDVADENGLDGLEGVSISRERADE